MEKEKQFKSGEKEQNKHKFWFGSSALHKIRNSENKNKNREIHSFEVNSHLNRHILFDGN
jgi:hypothetical protein